MMASGGGTYVNLQDERDEYEEPIPDEQFAGEFEEDEAPVPEEAPPELFKTVAQERIITDIRKRPDTLNYIFKYIDDHEVDFVNDLRDAVAIQSISNWPTARIECYRMIQFASDALKQIGFDVELRKVGKKPLNGSEDIPLPPVIMASLGRNPDLRTVLIYGHLDVRPADKADGWYCEPFYLTEEGECLYGRGASDNKGPVMGWLHAVEAYVKTGQDLTVNVKIILESMNESGSDGLDQLLILQKELFLSDVDVVVFSDSYWLGKTTPALTYGLRGLCYFFCEVQCGMRDLHSGVYGGTLYEAMPDLIWLLNQLVDAKGNIMIPGIMDHVCPVLPEEEELYKSISFDLEEFQRDAGIRSLRFPGDKTATLMNRWRFPALSIHGIQGAFDTPGAKVVIPRKVIGKFSIRLVPNQDPEMIEVLVKKYLKSKWEERKSPNKMLVYMADEGLKPWCANPFHPSFKAARQATAWTYGVIPDMIRDGGSVEKVVAFQAATGKNVVMLPMGSCDDRAHYTNEKINRSNYINGTKVFAAFLHEIGQVDKSSLNLSVPSKT